MDVFTMVVIIVVAGCSAGVANNYLRAKRQREKVAGDDEVSSELDELRERIEILEKIVTDEKYQLSRELHELERQA